MTEDEQPTVQTIDTSGETHIEYEEPEQDNMRFYDQVREVPKECTKPIPHGRLAGKTNIQPQWRTEALTRIFGPCGFGWYTKTKRQWMEYATVSETVTVTSTEEPTAKMLTTGKTGEDKKPILERVIYTQNKTVTTTAKKTIVKAFVDLDLYVRDPVTKEWSKAIEGKGGSSFVADESGGLYVSDEAYKMAETDAISVACKKLGFGANIYMGDAGETKYTAGVQQPSSKKEMSDADKKFYGQISDADMIAKLTELAKEDEGVQAYMNFSGIKSWDQCQPSVLRRAYKELTKDKI